MPHPSRRNYISSCTWSLAQLSISALRLNHGESLPSDSLPFVDSPPGNKKNGTSMYTQSSSRCKTCKSHKSLVIDGVRRVKLKVWPHWSYHSWYWPVKKKKHSMAPSPSTQALVQHHDAQHRSLVSREATKQLARQQGPFVDVLGTIRWKQHCKMNGNWTRRKFARHLLKRTRTCFPADFPKNPSGESRVSRRLSPVSLSYAISYHPIFRMDGNVKGTIVFPIPSAHFHFLTP